MRNGTVKNAFDTRDFSYERTFGSVDLSTLPEEYNADLGLGFPNQDAEGYPMGCTGYTQSETGQDEYGTPFVPSFVYENTLLIAGRPPGSPCKVRDSFKATKVYGLKPLDGVQSPEFFRRGNYFDVDRVGDYFDGARSALWLNRVNRRTLSCGTPWFKEWVNPGKDGILAAPLKYEWGSKTVGHNYKICGWKQIKNVPYLVVKAWQGPRFGDKGYVYMSREVFNKTLGISGTYLYIQTNAGIADIKRVKLDIMEVVLTFLRRILEQKYKEVPVSLPAPPAPEIEPKYKWDTVANARHSVRSICDEEGLSLNLKNIVTACVMQESGFQNYYLSGSKKGQPVTNQNKDPKTGVVWSTDWGIVQINDHKGWHIGPGLPFDSVQDVLDNPDKAVRYMARLFKAGKGKLWSSYASGDYKKWL